jgi:hypothetical protein
MPFVERLPFRHTRIDSSGAGSDGASWLSSGDATESVHLWISKSGVFQSTIGAREQRDVELLQRLARTSRPLRSSGGSTAIVGARREFMLLCRELDPFGGELAAIDGSK